MVTIKNEQYLIYDQLIGAIDNFKSAIQYNDATYLGQPRGIKVDRIVDIEEFVQSKDYMDLKRETRPAIMNKLIDLYYSDDYKLEVICTGAIGIGKTYFAILGLCYSLYLNSVLHNPQLEFGLPSGTSIYYIIQSLTATLAKKAVFNELTERIKNSGYFPKYFPYDKSISSELRFPNSIYITPFGGQDSAALGLNVMGAIIDEVNSMLRVENSVYTRYSADSEYDQASRIYNTIRRRMKNRFQTFGKVPGKLFLLGSTQYPGDFTDNKLKEAKTDSSIFVMKMAEWESIDTSRYSGKKFYIEVGNEFKDSRILKATTLEEAKAEAKDPEDVLEVPIESRSDFEKDIDGTLKDTAGIATSTEAPFMPRESIANAVKAYVDTHGERGIFNKDQIILSLALDPHPDYDQFLDFDFINNHIADLETVFAVHCDMALSECSCGLAVSRIVGYKLLDKARIYNKERDEFIDITDMRVPIYENVGVLSIAGLHGGEVDINQVRDLVIRLKQHLNIKWATCDSYQSVAVLQAWTRVRMRCGTLSMDTSMAPYYELKNALREGRILLRGPVLVKELSELQKVDNGRRVDHLPGGSKDLADAVAGSIYMLYSKEASFGRTSTRPRDSSMRYSRDQWAAKKPKQERVAAKVIKPNIRKVRIG